MAEQRKRVLIVDDNEQNLELLGEYLEGAFDPPLDVVRAVDGRSALDAAAAETPDLVLLDVMMPRMSGFQVCEQLKAASATAAVPVLFITALDDEGDLERARDAGGVGMMTKPVERAELIERVTSLLGY
jgi:two-component system alkaline phosphatase synthesis response regulator PhoP